MAEPNTKAASPAGWGRLLNVVALALTAAVIGLIVYLSVRPDKPPETSSTGVPRTTQAEDVLARARPLMEAGMFNGALGLLEAHVMSTPDDVDVRPTLARAYLGLGKLTEAERTVDDLLRLAPRLAEALWLKGEIVRRRGGKNHRRFFEMAVNKAVDAGPEIWARYGVEMLADGRGDPAQTYLTRALRAGLRDVRTLGGLGQLALEAGRFDEAEKLLAEALEHRRSAPDLWAMLAEAQKNTGKLAQADRTVQEAIRIRRSGPLYMLRGEICMLRRQRKEAAEAYATATEFARVRGEAALRAAKCYYLLERYGLAMKYIDLAAVLGGGDAEVLAWRTKIEDARFGRPEATPRPAGGLLKIGDANLFFLTTPHSKK